MKIFTGIVIANKMTNTVVVEKQVNYVHPLYRKMIKRTRKVKVHTTKPINIGDVIGYVSCKPISKDKFFKILEKTK